MTYPSDQTLARVKILEDYHGRALPGEARVYYVEALSHYPVTLLESIVKRWRDTNAPASRFPSLRDLRALADDVRTRSWSRTKNTENKLPLSQPTVAQDPAYQRSCWDLIRRAACMTKTQLADAFDGHHKLWPGHHWDDAARRLRAHITRSAA